MFLSKSSKARTSCSIWSIKESHTNFFSETTSKLNTTVHLFMSLCFCKSSLEHSVNKYQVPTVSTLVLQAYKYFYSGSSSQHVTTISVLTETVIFLNFFPPSPTHLHWQVCYPIFWPYVNKQDFILALGCQLIISSLFFGGGFWFFKPYQVTLLNL